MINAGALDQTIVIESLTPTQDSLGGTVMAWAAFATVRARAVSQKGAESFAAAQTAAKRTVKFQMRWLAGVAPTMRVTWRGDVYDIFDIDETMRRQGELWITATAQVTA